MSETVARANTKEAQLARLIATAQAAGLTIYGIEVEPRRFRLVTHPPLGESPPSEDAAERWLREQAAGTGKARGGS